MKPFDQRTYLDKAKKTLGTRTWSDFAQLVGLKERRLKTYLMPVASADHRNMDSFVKEKIDGLMAQAKARESTR